MKEISTEQLQPHLNLSDHAVVFLHTPLCGTCKLTKRMLEIVESMIPEVPLWEININTAPHIAQAWQIESVPCLAMMRNGQIVQRLYRTESVQFLYQYIQTFIKS